VIGDLSTAFYASYVAMWALLVVLAILVLLLYRHFGMMVLGTLEGVQRDGLPLGEIAPSITGVTADGTPVTWKPGADVPMLLVFAAPDCEPCAEIMPFVNRLALAGPKQDMELGVVVAGPQAMAERVEEKFNPIFECIAEDGSGAFERYRVRVTPFGFVVGEGGQVRAKGLCSDAHRLEELLRLGEMDGAMHVVHEAILGEANGAELRAAIGDNERR
jgi:hypothetical protein